MVALMDEEVAVNSLESLSLPMEGRDRDIGNRIISTIDSTTIQPDLKLSIESLLEANQEYSNNRISLVDEEILSSDATITTLGMITPVEGLNTF